MSILDDIKEGGRSTITLGFGVLSLVPAVLPVLAQGARPFLKGAVKGGLVCLEKGQEAVAEIRRVLDDVAAESRAEHPARPIHRPPPPAEPMMPSTGEPDPEAMG
ncbi:MAG: hypothetical protein H6R10_2269 [Rhodocyclaceae bacterium]|nr:hypothetical protein [Rhodocyclaceae bacterium]